MFKKVLIATDGSSHAKKALDIVFDLAANKSVTLVLVSVVTDELLPPDLKKLAQSEHLGEESKKPDPPLNVMGNLATDLGAGEELHKAYRVRTEIAQRLLQIAKADAGRRGIKDVKTEVLDGDPAKAILDTAKRTGADCIVIGSRGLGGLKGLLLGSVSHKVSQLATCTCITVR